MPMNLSSHAVVVCEGSLPAKVPIQCDSSACRVSPTILRECFLKRKLLTYQRLVCNLIVMPYFIDYSIPKESDVPETEARITIKSQIQTPSEPADILQISVDSKA